MMMRMNSGLHLILLILRRRDGSREWDMVESGSESQQPHVARVTGRVSVKEPVGEAEVERHCTLDLRHVLLGKPKFQGLDVVLEMIYRPPAHDGEDVRGLVHDIGQGNTREGCLLLVGNGLEDLGDLDLFLVGLDLATFPSLTLFICFECASA